MGGPEFGRKLRYAALTPALLLAGCIPQAHSADFQHEARKASNRQAPVRQAQYRERQRPTAARVQAQISPHVAAAQRALAQRIQQLGEQFDGDVGIAVRDVQSGWMTSYHGERYFPQQSVSKFWVALNAFQAADAGQVDLEQEVTVRREDLTLFHQPIAARIGPDGYRTSLGNLIFVALTRSDNTANDVVLRHGGGPEAIRSMFQRSGIEGVRFGPGERIMQSQIAGLQWTPAYSTGNAFYRARASVPIERRRRLFDDYVADPVDGATPEGIVTALARLRRGDLLSPSSTERMLSIMSQTRTGPQRLTGGLAAGWRIAHKTGTGQELGSTQTGYNDIGIITSPDGRHYALAVMIGRTSTPIPTRMELMQDVTRAAIAFHEAQRPGGGSTTR